MRKRLLALFLVIIVLITSTTATWIVTAGKTEGYSVAQPINKMESVTDITTVYNQKLSNFTTAFDYTPNADTSKLAIRYDYDSTLKKVAVDEDFEDYAVGDNVYGTITVAANSSRGLVGNVGQWKDSAATIFSGTDYDATFWLRDGNPDYGKMNIKIKDGVQLMSRGLKHGGTADTIGLYNSNITIDKNPGENDKLLASFKLSDYGYSYVKGEVYYRLVVAKDNIKVYINSVNDFEGLEPVLDYTLQPELANENSQLTFSQGNTGLSLDDIKVIDTTKPGYESTITTVGKHEKNETVFEEDFEDETAGEAIKGTASVVEKNGNNVLDFGKDAWEVKKEIATDLPRNGSIVLHAYGNHTQYDNIRIYFNEEWFFEFTGSGKNTDTGKYTVKLKNGNEVYAFANDFGTLRGNDNKGRYIKIEIIDDLVNLYVNDTNNFEHSEPCISRRINNLADKNRLYIYKWSNTWFEADNIKIIDTGKYTEEAITTFIGEYGKVELTNNSVSANKVNGTDTIEIKTEKLDLKAGHKYHIAVLRDRGNIKVTVNLKEVLSATVPFDDKNCLGEVAVIPENGTVSDILVYDSGRIVFEDKGAILLPFETAESITALSKSSENSSVKHSDNEVKITVDPKQNNSAASTTPLLAEETGDFVLDFYIKGNRTDYASDMIFFGVKGEIKNDEGLSYQFEPEKLYGNGYALELGVQAATKPIYNFYSLSNGIKSSAKRRTEPMDYHWGRATGHVRIERKGLTVRIYLAAVGEKPQLVDEVKADNFPLGNIYWYHRQADAVMMNIIAYDTANRIDYPAVSDNQGKKTELVGFYSTTKTDKDIPLEESKAIYEKVGPWYRIENPARNTVYLKESLTGEKEITNMDMSFEYYSTGDWMTHTLYLASSDKLGTTSYQLTVKGKGTAGLSEDGCNLILSRSYYGKNVVLDMAKVENLGAGVFKFHITIDNGKIKVFCKPKNAPDSTGTTLEGDNGGFAISGGVYMYIWDACQVRMKDIVIYNGIDTKNAQQPDLSIKKETIVKTDFENENDQTFESYKNNETGSFHMLDPDTGRFHVNCNGNNYIQVGTKEANDWLGDLTIQFDYQGHRGSWDLNHFAWHCSRKNGDRYSSVFLSILGNKAAENVENNNNVAGVKDANIQLIASENGKKTCLGWASIPEINASRPYSIRITQEGGNIKVWVWSKEQDMPQEPIIIGENYHPELCYGGLFIHSWSGNFSIDNLEILNYPNYEIPEPTSILNIEIGEIFRVDRIYEVVEDEKEEPIEVVEKEPEKDLNIPVIVGLSVSIVLLISATVVIMIVLKKRKSSIILNKSN